MSLRSSLLLHFTYDNSQHSSHKFVTSQKSHTITLHTPNAILSPPYLSPLQIKDKIRVIRVPFLNTSTTITTQICHFAEVYHFHPSILPKLYLSPLQIKDKIRVIRVIRLIRVPFLNTCTTIFTQICHFAEVYSNESSIIQSNIPTNLSLRRSLIKQLLHILYSILSILYSLIHTLHHSTISKKRWNPRHPRHPRSISIQFSNYKFLSITRISQISVPLYLGQVKKAIKATLKRH